MKENKMSFYICSKIYANIADASNDSERRYEAEECCAGSLQEVVAEQPRCHNIYYISPKKHDNNVLVKLFFC